MKNIINSHDLIKDLVQHNLTVNDKKMLNFYIKNFNFNTVILNYSDVLYENEAKRRYDPEATSNDLISLYKFDHDLGNHILRFILVIEKMLNTNVAYEIINNFHISDRCLFRINEKYITQNVFSNFKDVETHLSPKMFMHSLVKYCSTNHITKPYYNPNGRDELMKWESCPLDIMCLTWSFSTTLSLFIGLNDSVRCKIMSNFGLYPKHLSGMIDFFKNILHMRNQISHNYIIYNANIKYQSQSLNDIYEFIFNKKVDHISVMNLIEMIQHFSFSKTLVSNTNYYLKKIKMADKFKQRVIEKLNK